ncbi:MAG: dual specificity protein phosphatase family protein [Sulfobacillus sp.]
MAPANEILPDLWLGDFRAATSEEFLIGARITTVVNCTTAIPFFPKVPRKLRVPVRDNLDPAEIQKMYLLLDRVVDSIWERRKGGAVLIHCHLGRQRSVTVLLAYLMKYGKLTLEQALGAVRSRRPVAGRPQLNFRAALSKYENDLNAMAPPIQTAKRLPKLGGAEVRSGLQQGPMIQKQAQKPTIQKRAQEPTIPKRAQEPTIQKRAQEPTIQKRAQEPTIQKRAQELPYQMAPHGTPQLLRSVLESGARGIPADRDSRKPAAPVFDRDSRKPAPPVFDRDSRKPAAPVFKESRLVGNPRLRVSVVRKGRSVS